MNTLTLRARLNAVLRLPDAEVKQAIRELLNLNRRQPGAKKATGKFDTREDLERYVWRMARAAYKKHEIATKCGISAPTVASILNGAPPCS